MQLASDVLAVVWLLFMLTAAFLAAVPLAVLFGVMCFIATALGTAALPFVVVAGLLQRMRRKVQ